MTEAAPPSSLRPVASYLGMVAGLATFGYGLMSSFGDAPLPFAVALVVAGFTGIVACFFASRRNRAAWSFAISLYGTGSVIFLFGASRVRDGLEVHWLLALVPAVVFLLVTVLLAMSAQDYEG
jgi:hypothetical protein